MFLTETMLFNLEQFISESPFGLTLDDVQVDENPHMTSIEVRLSVHHPVQSAELPSNVKLRAYGTPVLTYTFTSTQSVEENMRNFESFVLATAGTPVVVPKIIRR